MIIFISTLANPGDRVYIRQTGKIIEVTDVEPDGSIPYPEDYYCNEHPYWDSEEYYVMLLVSNTETSLNAIPELKQRILFA